MIPDVSEYVPIALSKYFESFSTYFDLFFRFRSLKNVKISAIFKLPERISPSIRNGATKGKVYDQVQS